MPSTLNDFDVVSTIGTGSYGTCKKIRRKKDGKLLVWKEMDYGSMSEGEKQMLVSEVNLLRELKHPNIVRYYDRIIDRSRTTIYIIMEYCEEGDLSTLISHSRKTGALRRYPIKCNRAIHQTQDMNYTWDKGKLFPVYYRTYVDEEFVWKILIQITQALNECHKRKNGKAVLHRDLKPANVFLDGEKNVKLGDFGLARVLHHETSFAKTYVGTPYYMSPELVNNMSYNEKSDIWALGCMMYEFCALHPPFTAINQTDLNRRIRNGEFSRLPYRYSDDLDKIIRKMIVVEVVKRPSIAEILKDPLIVRHCKNMDVIESRSSEISEPKLSGHVVSALTEDLKQLQEELKMKQKRLNEKEKELESREKQIRKREKELKDKMERVEMEEEKYKELISRHQREEVTKHTDIDDLLNLDGHSCLAQGKRDGDTPKKKVTFETLNSKENRKNKEKYETEYNTNIYDNRYSDIYAREFAKRQELKDRLYKAKSRALELKGLDYDRKIKSSNFLHLR